MTVHAAITCTADVDWTAPEQQAEMAEQVLTGFFLLECADLDEAVALAAQIPAAWSGAVEVRPVIPRGAPPA